MKPNTPNEPKINLEEGNASLEVCYKPKTERTLYDICDFNGRILKTGGIQQDKTVIDLNELFDDQYILLILDGDKICSKTFRLDR